MDVLGYLYFSSKYDSKTYYDVCMPEHQKNPFFTSKAFSGIFSMKIPTKTIFEKVLFNEISYL